MKRLNDVTRKRRTVRNACALLLAAAAIGAAGSAYADPIGYLPVNSDVKFKYSNEEILITGADQSLYGIFNISQITNNNNTATYWNGNGGTDGSQLVGFFYGLTSTLDPGNLAFTGGHMVVYNVPNGQYDPAAAINGPLNTSNIQDLLCGGAACPTPWLTADFVPGINDTLAYGFDTNITLNSAIAPSAPAVAQGSGYLSVADNATYGNGAHNGYFDSNQYTFPDVAPADLFLKSEFSSCVNVTDPACTADSWQVVSDDPVFARTVPEPGTLALLGLGLLGAGAFRRKKVRA